MKEKKKAIIALVSLGMLVTSSFILHYYFDIYPFVWHVIKYQPIKWYDLKITVPEGMVAKVKNQRDAEIVEVYFPKQPKRAYILFSKSSCKIPKNLDLKYDHSEYRIIEEKECNILGMPCIWVTVEEVADMHRLISKVYFIENNIIVYFNGDRMYKKYFDEIISSLQ